MQTLPNELRSIGDHVKARRITLHSFQADVAKQIGVHFASIQNWERNVGVPMPAQIPAVIRFLGYSPFPKAKCRGDMLREVRVCCGWTQRDLAKAARCAESTIARWEAGERPDSKKWVAAIKVVRKRLDAVGITGLVSARISELEQAGYR